MAIGGLKMNEISLQQMTASELKKYLSAHRNDTEKFSAVLGELMNRDIWTEVSADRFLAEQEAIIQNLIESKNNS
jgi:hypothetical protein